jgi:hypothetical protein
MLAPPLKQRSSILTALIILHSKALIIGEPIIVQAGLLPVNFSGK